MSNERETWTGTVVDKSRGLLDGSNLYRRLEVRLEDGEVVKVKVGKDVWKSVEVGDAVEKREGQDPAKA